MKLLIIDDSLTQRVMYESLLENDGHEVFSAENGMEGLRIAEKERPELIIVDLWMPDINGFKVCEAIKGDKAKYGGPFIIFITADPCRERAVEGYTLGAVDYLYKNMPVQELLMKIKNLSDYLERKSENEDIKGFCMNHERMSVLEDNKDVELTVKEYLLLRYLCENRKKILSKQELMENVWQEKYMESAENSIEAMISRLRKKVVYVKENLKTKMGKGYYME